MAAFVLVVVVTALGLGLVYFPGGHDPAARPSQVLAADAVQTITRAAIVATSPCHGK